MTLVEEMMKKTMEDMRARDAQPEKELSIPFPESDRWPRLVLRFLPDEKKKKTRFTASGQGLLLSVEKLADGMWQACLEDTDSGVIVAMEHVQAGAPDTAQLEGYIAVKDSLAVLPPDLKEYRKRVTGAEVIFTEPDGTPKVHA